MYFIFQSTSPVRGMTPGGCEIAEYAIFQSTSPVRGMTLPVYAWDFRAEISIHIPGDDLVRKMVLSISIISSTSPCGDDMLLLCRQQACRYFNPHLPCGDDRRPSGYVCGFRINPHPPCGDDRAVRVDIPRAVHSIHIPRADDACATAKYVPSGEFHPHPVRG